MHLKAITVVVSMTTVLFLHSDGELIMGLRNTESKVGETTYFNCSTNLTSREIFWFHGDKFIYTGIFIYEPYDMRFTIERKASSGSSSLVIHSVEPGDAGEYTCIDGDGSGDRHSAQLVVLNNDPDCQSDIQPDGVIGQNLFNVPQDEVNLTCTVTYHGNIPPQLEWKKVEDEGTINERAPSYNISSNNGFIKYTLTLKGDISLDKSSYVCKTTRSTQKQFKCTSEVIKVLYALNGNTIEKDVVRGNDITCITKNNTFPCINQWYIGNDSCPLSCDETITTHLLGEYVCTVKCHIRGTDYLFTALKAFVVEPPPSKSGIIAASALIAVVIIALIGLFIKLYRYIKQNENRLQTLHELEEQQTLIDVERDKEDQKRLLEQKNEEEKLKPLGLVTLIRTNAAAKDKKSIRGLVILDKKLFVVSKESSEVEVYDSIKFSLSHQWNLKELFDPMDIVSCETNKCLYISDNKDDSHSSEILRVDKDGKLLLKWSTKDGSGKLSITFKSTVILIIRFQNKLYEYSTNGLFLREINLSRGEGFRHPLHAIELTNGQFIVCHGVYDQDDDDDDDDDADNNLHRVCKVDADGKLLNSFGEKPGSTNEQTNIPYYLFVCGNGLVIVAEWGNSRVLLLDSDLKFRKQIITKEDGLRYPVKILLDESNDRLFVADNDCNRLNPRIMIFNYNNVEQKILT